MSQNEVDRSKRRFLIAATTAVGGVAAAATAIPFVVSMMPSQRAKAAGAPVEVDISKIEPGMIAECGMARQAGMDREPHQGNDGFAGES